MFLNKIIPSRETWNSSVEGITGRVVTSISDDPLVKQYIYFKLMKLSFHMYTHCTFMDIPLANSSNPSKSGEVDVLVW